MRTYILKQKGETVATIKAQNKEDLRKKASQMLPPGYYVAHSPNGLSLYGISTEPKAMARAEKKRPRLPLEEYNQLYLYVPGQYMARINKGELDPLSVRSPRRYDTIDDVRKAALAKSKKVWKDIVATMDAGYRYIGDSMDIHIFKGTVYIGCVEYNTLKDKMPMAYDGLWYPKEHPKDPSPLLADGRIGSRPIKASQKRK